MRRLILRIAPINRRITREDRGGITLEAAIVMPIFLIVVVFLIAIIQTAVISMALQGALSQTARQAASAWYPIALGMEQARASELNQTVEHWNDKWMKVSETIQHYAQWLPSPAKDWAEQLSKENFSLEQHAAKLVFTQLLSQFMDERMLSFSRVTLTSVELPEFADRMNSYLTLHAEYSLPLRFPFSGRRVVLQASARERVWIGGSSSKSLLIPEGHAQLNVTFVSLEPNPVRPGRKATLILRTMPGTVVDLSILYKSGLSHAKNLGAEAADSSGLISWTWHVSGRTTPGQWQWQVRNAKGESYQQAFTVASTK